MKIPDPYFENVPQIGDLFMEKILVEYVYPLFSVLRDSCGSRYLCTCFDTQGEQRWLLSKTNASDLRAVLTNRLELQESFLKAGQECILVKMDYHTREESYQFLPAYKVPLEYLPEAGELLDAEPGEWSDYIQDLCSGYVSNLHATMRVAIIKRSLPMKYPASLPTPGWKWAEGDSTRKTMRRMCYA